MRVEKKPKAFAYRVPIGDYNYLQCNLAYQGTPRLILLMLIRHQKQFPIDPYTH